MQALSESFGHTLELSGKRTRMNLRFAGQYFDEEMGRITTSSGTMSQMLVISFFN
ncbi:hypothetical protein [Delftia acidovorans]|uniref:hypothetical protein n=1 Tax=Delftia acidovorans TaxID=80866 RepID=UPI001ED94CDC|nr:hypothetical protein [Delftia acidovorans]